MTDSLASASSAGGDPLPGSSPCGSPVVRLLEIAPRNILSFGPDAAPLRLNALNVLIGPNGSGKSNLLDCIALLRSAPAELARTIQRGGGVGEWIWKGRPGGSASIDVVVSTPGGPPLRHVLAFEADRQGFRITDERIEDEHVPEGGRDLHAYYGLGDGLADIRRAGGEWVNVHPDRVSRFVSILAQRRDPDAYPQLARLTETYEQIHVYREWSSGRNTLLRHPQPADARNHRLEEDFSNLGLYLSRLRRTPKAKAAVLAGLKDLFDEVSDFDVSVEGGTVQVFFTERDFTIPAVRLSDGSLRHLCLLAILCDPDPPPLVCIEEPELGLHPDLIPKIADLLVAASERCQLVVTTHSDILVDALSDQPESVVVCEKQEGKTSMRRLSANEIAPWLADYRLGQLWTRGQIGGTRW